MSVIPLKMRGEMEQDPYYHTCARQTLLHDHVCGANPMTGQKIEWEHALYYRGSKIQRKFAIVPLCWHVHSGPALRKQINEWIALNQATDDELKEFNKAIDYIALRRRLNEVYGTP